MGGDKSRMELITAYTGAATMAVMLIALSYVLYRVCKQARFRFIIQLILLLMVSDLALGVMAVGFYFEGDVMSLRQQNALAATIGICTFFYNFGTMTMLWLFSYKYWVIAREVPKLFFEAGRDITFNERSYRIFNVCGLVTNFIPCCLLGYYRGRLTADSSNGNGVPSDVTHPVQHYYYACTGLELVSTLFLCDALRRIKKSVKSNPFLSSDTKTLWLHITMVFL